MSGKEIGTFQAQQIKLGEATAALKLHLPAGSHIGRPSGFLIWQALAPFMLTAKSDEFSWISLSQHGTSHKTSTSIPPSTVALASTSR